MKIKHIREITSPNEVLILEINDRVNEFLYREELSDIDKVVLGIDLNSLRTLASDRIASAMASNLIDKIKYLLKESE